MSIIKTMAGINIRPLIFGLTVTLIFNCIACHNNRHEMKRGLVSSGMPDSTSVNGTTDEYLSVYTLLVLPRNPVPGETFRILATGGENIRKAQIIVSGPSGSLASLKSKIGEVSPYWRIDDFTGSPVGRYKVTLMADKKVIGNLEFIISPSVVTPQTGAVWKTLQGWDSGTEAIYSAWINALFHGCDEHSSWSALHEVTQNPNQNFLYNYLSLGEDDPKGKIKLIMQPDCADNPFYLRAYFAWKLGLPFGYHVCDRGSLVHNPKAGQWITNETSSSKTHPVLAFNAYLRRVMDGVHSGTARIALDDENSDYYPVSLERGDLRPGIVFADPYGHTLILVSWVPKTNEHPGTIIPMPSSAAGVFQTGGQWEDFSTPNRDLRLLIAMDAVLDFPDLVARSPEDFNISSLVSPERVKKKLQSFLDQKGSELSISYIRTNGSLQKLTVAEILKRRDAFEMAYNPNDGIEIRWGAPENSDERATCHRHTPSKQLETMRSVRMWFHKQLHPPT